jgi:hypothetical protein
MRRNLAGGWSIELPEVWKRRGAEESVEVWGAPGRTLRVSPGAAYRCATTADIIAEIDAGLPADVTGKVGEGGNNGVGVRAAWFYRHDAGACCSLYGYSFVDDRYLETIFNGSGTADAAWAFDAWRSVAYAPARPDPRADRPR